MSRRKLGGKRIFIIHGRNKSQRENLKSALASYGLEPVILSREDVRGAETLIEKFESTAPTCNFAVALFTPDDIGRLNLTENADAEPFQRRARQNVLVELGWFMAHVGRKKTFIVTVGAIEIPSDLRGIETHRVQTRIKPTCKKLRTFFQTALGTSFPDP